MKKNPLLTPPRLITPTAEFAQSLTDPPTAEQPLKLAWIGVPEMNGLNALMAIRGEFPEARVIMLTTYNGDVQVMRSMPWDKTRPRCANFSL